MYKIYENEFAQVFNSFLKDVCEGAEVISSYREPF